MEVKKGEIFLADLEPIKGHEQGGIRPVLIIQNNIYNQHSPVTIISAITSKIFDKEYPTNIFISKEDSGLEKDSTILLNQLRTIDKLKLIKPLAKLDLEIMKRVDLAIKVSLELLD